MRKPGLYSFGVIVLLFISARVNAQDYLVTSKGDTLVGQVKPLAYGPDKKVQLIGEDKKKAVFPMFQVKSFRFRDEIYQPIKGPEGYTFMKLVKEGYVSMFAYQLANQVTYDGTYLQRRDGKGIDVPNLGFKKYMKNFLEDCPVVADKIDRGEYSKRELPQIIDEYNACINNKTVDHNKIITNRVEATKKLSAWDVLEEKVKTQSDFDGKSNALDMITEIKGKISKNEKIPNFLIEGLKNALAQDTFKTELDAAIAELN